MTGHITHESGRIVCWELMMPHCCQEEPSGEELTASNRDKGW